MTEVFTYTAYRLANEADVTTPDSLESPGSQFLLGIQDSVNERLSFGDDLEDAAHEIADSAVPIHTHAMWQTFIDIGAYNEDPSELGADYEDMRQPAVACLYLIAHRLASKLIQEATETVS
jgi:hypothetical protein